MITEFWYAAGLAERPTKKVYVEKIVEKRVYVEKKPNVIMDFQYDTPVDPIGNLYFGYVC